VEEEELQRLMWAKWVGRRKECRTEGERAKAEKTQRDGEWGGLLYDSTGFLKEWLSCCLGNFFEMKVREKEREKVEEEIKGKIKEEPFRCKLIRNNEEIIKKKVK
jgi:hypothetical protein